MENKAKRNIIIMIVSIVLVAGLGTLFVNLGNGWFNGLTKPTEWIPNILIPIVWTVIYITAGVILFFWIKKDGALNTRFTTLFIINGALNILWCLTFFTLNQLFVGLVVIILNLIFAAKLAINIGRYNLIYSYILSIYPTWLAIATCLNIAVWILN